VGCLYIKIALASWRLHDVNRHSRVLTKEYHHQHASDTALCAPSMSMALHDEGHVDILMSLLVFCSATSLCKLAQTCRLFRSLFLEKGEETAIRRLELFSTGRERFCELLKEFGGMSVANTGIVLATVFHIDKAMLVDAQKSVVEEMMKKTSLLLDKNFESIVQIQMNTEGVKLIQNFWEKGLFPFESKMKELHYFETAESSLFDTIVTLQCILIVFLNAFTSSDLIAWLKSKVSLLPLSLLPVSSLSLQISHLTFVCVAEFQSKLCEPDGGARDQRVGHHFYDHFIDEERFCG
jgi:hypothetical protein